MSSGFESTLKAGYADLGSRQLQSALAQFQAATELAPDHPQGWAALAHAQLLLGQPKTALTSLARSTSSAYGLNLKAQCLKSLERWDGAIEAALESRRVDPNQPQLEGLLSDLYWSRSRGKDLADMRNCLRHGPHQQAFRKVVLASSADEALAQLQRYPQLIDYDMRQLQFRLLRQLGRHFEHLAVRAASGHWPDWETWDTYLDSVPKIVIHEDLEKLFGREPILACLRRPEQPSRCPSPLSGGWSGSHWRQELRVNFTFYADRVEVKVVRDIPGHYHRESLRGSVQALDGVDVCQPCLPAEYEVFRALIPDQPGVVCRQRTIRRPPGRAEIQRLARVETTTCEQFLSRNQVAGWLEAELGRQILSENEQSGIFSYAQTGGIYEVSRVGFSEGGQQALVAVGHQVHGEAGFGRLVLLQRQDRTWQVEAETTLWIS